MSPDVNTWLGQVPWVPLGVAAAFAVLWFFALSGGKKKKEALSAKLAQGAHVVDVRSQGEFAGGHYPGAVNIPVDTLAKLTKKLGAPDRPLVVYCASGGRSAQAAGILRSAGFIDVTDAGAMANLPR